jgi:hypothetical protein
MVESAGLSPLHDTWRDLRDDSIYLLGGGLLVAEGFSTGSNFNRLVSSLYLLNYFTIVLVLQCNVIFVDLRSNHLPGSQNCWNSIGGDLIQTRKL